MVFNEVCDDLEREGYEVQPFLIPAASVNAPHQRQRIWFIAYANDKGGSTRSGQVQSENGKISEWNDNAEFSNTDNKYASNPISIRLEHSQERGDIYKSTEKTQGERSQFTESIEANGYNGIASNATSNGRRQDNWFRESRFINQKGKTNKWDNFPTQSPICGGDDGLPRELDGITFSRWRKESIKAYGNAIVPQVAFEIFKTINIFEEQLKNQ
jgi:DNA (cytosine-5)-methyltransferase 1